VIQLFFKNHIYRAALVLGVVASAQMASIQTHATQPTLEFTPAKSWDVALDQSRVAGQDVELCRAQTEFDNGFIVIMHAYDRSLESVQIDFRQNIFTPGDVYPAQITLPREQLKHAFEGRAMSTSLLAMNTAGTQTLLNDIQSNKHLDLNIDGNDFRFDLKGFDQAADALQSCLAGLNEKKDMARKAAAERRALEEAKAKLAQENLLIAQKKEEEILRLEEQRRAAQAALEKEQAQAARMMEVERLEIEKERLRLEQERAAVLEEQNRIAEQEARARIAAEKAALEVAEDQRLEAELRLAQEQQALEQERLRLEEEKRAAQALKEEAESVRLENERQAAQERARLEAQEAALKAEEEEKAQAIKDAQEEKEAQERKKAAEEQKRALEAALEKERELKAQQQAARKAQEAKEKAEAERLEAQKIAAAKKALEEENRKRAEEELRLAQEQQELEQERVRLEEEKRAAQASKEAQSVRLKNEHQASAQAMQEKEKVAQALEYNHREIEKMPKTLTRKEQQVEWARAALRRQQEMTAQIEGRDDAAAEFEQTSERSVPASEEKFIDLSPQEQERIIEQDLQKQAGILTGEEETDEQVIEFSKDDIQEKNSTQSIEIKPSLSVQEQEQKLLEELEEVSVANIETTPLPPSQDDGVDILPPLESSSALEDDVGEDLAAASSRSDLEALLERPEGMNVSIQSDIKVVKESQSIAVDLRDDFTEQERRMREEKQKILQDPPKQPPKEKMSVAEIIDNAKAEANQYCIQPAPDMRYQEVERQVRNLAGQIKQERVQCQAETEKLEDMLFDPILTERAQMAKLVELRQALEAAQEKIKLLEAAQEKEEARMENETIILP
jgi:hypothetical protein